MKFQSLLTQSYSNAHIHSLLITRQLLFTQKKQKRFYRYGAVVGILIRNVLCGNGNYSSWRFLLKQSSLNSQFTETTKFFLNIHQRVVAIVLSPDVHQQILGTIYSQNRKPGLIVQLEVEFWWFSSIFRNGNGENSYLTCICKR